MIDIENTKITLSPQKTIGALSDTEMLLLDVVQGKRVLRSILLPPDVSELNRLLEQVCQVGLTELWVMPASTLSRTATCAWFEQANSHWVVIVHPDPHDPTRPISALLWPKGSSHRGAYRLEFVFPEKSGWDWVLPDARSMLATVTYLDQTLARPITDSPTLVAHRMLTDLASDQSTSWLQSPSDPSTGDHKGPLPTSTPLPPLRSSDEMPIPMKKQALTWMRPLTLVEQRQRYLHKYTHLSFALEACIAVSLGAGTPQYSSNGRACDDIRPGIWRVSAERAGSLFDGKRLPSCLDGEWMSTPQVKCCRNIGYQVYVREGYFWPQTHELLKGWATTLWQAGERLYTHPQHYRHIQGRVNTAHTIKLLAQIGISIIAQEKIVGGWSRPDWWAQVMGQSGAILFAHLVGLARKGTMPVLVDGDALWVVSNDPNPLTAVPGLVNARRWRGYSIDYEVPLPLSTEVREAFRTAEHASQLVAVLDTLAGEVFP